MCRKRNASHSMEEGGGGSDRAEDNKSSDEHRVGSHLVSYLDAFARWREHEARVRFLTRHLWPLVRQVTTNTRRLPTWLLLLNWGRRRKVLLQSKLLRVVFNQTRRREDEMLFWWAIGNFFVFFFLVISSSIKWLIDFCQSRFNCLSP